MWELREGLGKVAGLGLDQAGKQMKHAAVHLSVPLSSSFLIICPFVFPDSSTSKFSCSDPSMPDSSSVSCCSESLLWG